MFKIVIRVICLVLVIACFATSCQKELSTEILGTDSTGIVIVDPGNTGNPNGLLVKLDIRGGASATDSSITYYTYDAAKRLISSRLVGSSSGGVSPNNSYIYTRDANGIITQVVQKNATLSLQGVDSIVTKVVYDATTAHYKYALTKTDLISLGIVTYDSAVFVYDGTGKLSQYISYDKGFTTILYAPLQRFDFAYTGSQFTSMKAYQYDATTASFSVVANYAFAYDSKVNPIQYGIDAPIIIYSPESVNNGTSESFSSSAAGNFSLSTVYTYNSVNKPATATITRNFQGVTIQKATFYYQ